MERAIVLILLCVSGCAGTWLYDPVDPEEELILAEARSRRAEMREHAEADRPDLEQLTERGRFDLGCPDAKALVLGRNSSGPAVLIGVTGCDRQVKYSRRLRAGFWGRTTKNTHWEMVHEPTLVTRVERR